MKPEFFCIKNNLYKQLKTIIKTKIKMKIKTKIN